VMAWAGHRRGEIARATRTAAEALAGQPNLAKVSVAAGALKDLIKA
jgi:hypothetical protein